MTCVEYPTRYSDAPTKVPLVKHLTVRPTPIMPAYEQIIVEAGKPEVVNPLFPSLTAMFPRVHSFTLKDTLVLCSEDAKCVFAALANVAPKKARIELRMWDLYDSAIGPDLIAATRPNVYAIPQPRPTGAMSSPPNGAGVHSSPILPISTQQAWRDSIVAGLDLHLPSEWVDPRQSNNDGDQDNNNNHNLISAPRIIPGPGPGQAPSRMTGPNSSGATRGILINGPAGTSNNRTLFTGLTQRLGSSAGPRSSPSVIAAAMMSIPQVSRYGLQNVSRAARRIATMAADETMNDENDSRERDNQQDADSEGDGDAWGLDSDSETSEGLARALRDEANMGAAEERRIRLNAARTRTVKARDQAEEARYNILLARASAGVTCGDYGDEEDPALGDPGYIRLRDAWRAAEAEERAIAEETNAELGRAGDAGSSSNPSVLRSTNSSPAPAPAVPNAARSRTVTAPGHGAAILSGQASTTASGVATTTAPTSNLPLRVDTSSISAPAPTSSKSQPRQPIQPVMAAARDFIHTRSASAGTSSTPAFGDSDGTGVVTRARAISLKSTPPTASMSPTVAGQIQPSSSANTTPTAPATGSTPKALPSYGLTYAQRCRVDHIYYPPQQEADPPVAGPSGTSDSSGLSRSFVESDSGITQFRPGTVPNPNVGGSANTAPVRLTASVRQTRGASYFQAHQMRTMLLELIQNQWSQSLEAFSFVAFDPLASLVVRAPKLDFWVNVPVEHIRVHLPRGVNSLAIFKSAKQMERDRIQARRETAPDARNEETGGDEEDPVLAILATLADGILPEDEMVQVVGGDAMGYGLVHPSNRLFEIEVNTVRDMMDDMWIQAGSQLPPQVCRILLGEQDWSEVIPGEWSIFHGQIVRRRVDCLTGSSRPKAVPHLRSQRAGRLPFASNGRLPLSILLFQLARLKRRGSR